MLKIKKLIWSEALMVPDSLQLLSEEQHTLHRRHYEVIMLEKHLGPVPDSRCNNSELSISQSPPPEQSFLWKMASTFPDYHLDLSEMTQA